MVGKTNSRVVGQAYGTNQMTDKKPEVTPKETVQENMVRPRPPVGTYNSYENEFLTVLHLLKYNLHLNAKAIVFAGLLAKTSTTEEAVEATQRVMEAMRLKDDVK